ncbi:hypothetical protein D3C85_1424630 [compost metagenome]
MDGLHVVTIELQSDDFATGSLKFNLECFTPNEIMIKRNIFAPAHFDGTAVQIRELITVPTSCECARKIESQNRLKRSASPSVW